MQGARRLKKSRAAGASIVMSDASSYMSGFGNSFETEALPGALPVGRNSPQKCPYGLYAEQLSARPSPCPRRPISGHGFIASGRRETCGPLHARGCGTVAHGAAARDESSLPLGQLRWAPVAIPAGELSFVTGLCTVTTAGDADTRSGMAAHYLFVTRSMRDEYFMNCDGELLIVVQENSLRLVTEFGVIEVSPGEICVIPRGVIFRAELIGGPVRGYVCENYGASFTLPDRGPIGANCLANPRDFLVPVARMKIAKRPRCSLRNGAAKSSAARSRNRRSMSSRGTATTRHTNTICAVSRLWAPCCSTIPIRRSSPF